MLDISLKGLLALHEQDVSVKYFVSDSLVADAQSTAALPFGTIVIIFLIWALITIPLTILGGIIGKNTRTEFKAPCRTNK